MEINKETLKQARRAPTHATHRAVLAALDVLDMQPIHKSFTLPHWAVATVAAATVVALVAAVPPLRHRATNLALDVLGRAIPQADRVNPAAGGVTPLPSDSSAGTSMFLLLDQAPYPQLTSISQAMNISQTINGITVTIEEAALTADKLYLAIRTVNAPGDCDLENMTIQLDGNSEIDSSGYGNNNQEYLYCFGLKTPIRTTGTALSVKMSFDLKAITVQNKQLVTSPSLGSFVFDFSVTMGQTILQFDEPAGAYETTAPTPAPSANPANSPTDLSQATAMAVPATTAAAETTAVPGNELPTPRPSSGPETTAMPSSAPQTTAPGVIMPDITWVPPALGGADTKALSPASVDLPEMAGVTYAELTQQNIGIILEMPNNLQETQDKSWMSTDMAKKTDLFLGWKDDRGSFYICTGKYGIQNNLWKAANYVANQWSGEVNGQLYTIDGQEVCLMEDAKGQLACIILLPSDAPYKMNVSGDTVTIWGTPAYIHHALKTMRLDSTAVK